VTAAMSTIPNPDSRPPQPITLALLAASLALIAIATPTTAATQQLEFANVTIYDFGSQHNGAVDLVDGYYYNGTTYGICYGYDNFNAHRVALSDDQGVNWRVYDFFNQTGTPGDANSCRLSHNGGGIGGEWLGFSDSAKQAFFKQSGFNSSSWNTFGNFENPVRKGADAKILDNGTYAITYYFEDSNSNANAVIALSHDKGQTWNEKTAHVCCDSSSVLDFASWNSSQMWIAIGQNSNSNTDIIYSQNGGKTWTLVSETGCSQTDKRTYGLNLKAQSNTFLTMAQGQRHFQNGNREVCFLTSNNEGNAWTEEVYTRDQASEWACRSNARPNLHYINSNNYFFACYGQGRTSDIEQSWVLFKDDGDFVAEYIDQTQRGGDSNTNYDADDGSMFPTVLNDASLYTTVTINRDTGIMENQKKDAPPPSVVDQTEIFGNAGTVRVDWKTTENVYVLDTQPENTIWYGRSKDLSGFAEPSICGTEEADAFAAIDDASDSTGVSGMHVSSPRFEDTFTVSYRCEALDSNGVQIAGAFARSGGELSALCEGQRSWCDEDVIVGVDTSPNTVALTELESREANELVGGITAGSEQGSFSLTADGDDAIAANKQLPDATDFAVDHNLDADLRYCGVSDNASIGVRCYNADGGEITNSTATNGDEIDVYDNEVWINNATEISRWERSGSSLVKLANNTVSPAIFHGVTKDGQYLLGTDFDPNTGKETIVEIYHSDTLELITESEPIGDSTLRGLDTDYSNNYAYATDSTTLYKIDIFNSTSSQDGGEGVIGQENPQTGEEPQVDNTDDGTTNGDASTGGSAITDLSDASNSLGIAESDFAVLMSTIAVFTFAGGAFLATASLTGQPSPMLAAAGALAGAGLSVAYGWMPGWLLLLVVLVLTATIVLIQTRGNG
jgi:hypothetical protein